MKLRGKIFFGVILLAFLLVNIVHAQGIVNCNKGPNNCEIRDLFQILIRLINFLIGFSWLVAILFVFWGAYGLATSYGNSEKIEGSKKTIQQAIVGLFLSMLGFLLVNFIVSALGGFTFKELFDYLPFK